MSTGHAVLLMSVVVLGACSPDSSTSPDTQQRTSPSAFPEWTGIVSSPVLPVGIAGVGLAAGQNVVYISLAPGSLPTAQRVNITSTRTRDVALYPVVVDGGFDPVAIAAEVGDTLLFGVERTTGGPAVFTYVARAGTAPTVVRVSPSTHAPNVRLDESIFVVISEPLDARAVAPGAIGLLDASVPLSARVKFREASATSVEIVPEAPLRFSTAYEVDVTSAVVGRTGVPLSRPTRTDFTTVAEPSPAALAITSFTVLEFQYPGMVQWYYAPQIVVAESGAKGGAEIRRLDFTIPGLGNMPPMCSTGISIPAGRTVSLVNELYGDWEFTMFGSKRADPGEAAVTLTYVDATGRRVTLAARGPVVSGSLPTTYTGGRSSMSPGSC